MNKFDILYEEIMGSLESKRKGLQKIDQMNTKDFLEFLREILPLFKDNKLDLDNVIITEKSDGTAIRLAVLNNDLLFESSYSGLVSWDKMPFPEQTELMYKHLKDKFIEVANQIGFDFKLIGELIWCNDLVENEKVTPVGASYLAKHFGTLGGIIIINLKKIINNELLDLTKDEYIKLIELIKNISDDKFNFYSKESDMKFSTPIELHLNIDELIQLLKRPEYNKTRYSVKTDLAIINQIEEIKQEFLDQLENIINSTTGHFSAEGDLIEGLVLTVLNSGNEYGVFSRNYKTMKNNYVKYENNIEQAFYTFLNTVFNNKSLPIIRKKYNTFDKEYCMKQFENAWKIFYNEFLTNYNLLKNDPNIPKASKYAQLKILDKKLNRYSNIQTYQDFESKIMFTS
jgi:hypothetical protein